MKCKYCRKPAEWFHRSHAECLAHHEIGRTKIMEHFKWFFQSDMNADLLCKRAREIADRHLVSSTELHSLAVASFNDAIDAIVSCQAPSREQENKLTALTKEFSLTLAEIEGPVKRLIEALFKGYLHSNMPVAELAQRAREIAHHHSVSATELRRLAIASFQKLVDTVLEDQLVTQEEETKLALLQNDLH